MAACRRRRFRRSDGVQLPGPAAASRRQGGCTVFGRRPVPVACDDTAVARKERRSGRLVLLVLRSTPLRRKMRPLSPGRAEGRPAPVCGQSRSGQGIRSLLRKRTTRSEWWRVGRGGFEGPTGLCCSVRLRAVFLCAVAGGYVLARSAFLRKKRLGVAPVFVALRAAFCLRIRAERLAGRKIFVRFVFEEASVRNTVQKAGWTFGPVVFIVIAYVFSSFPGRGRRLSSGRNGSGHPLHTNPDSTR